MDGCSEAPSRERAIEGLAAIVRHELEHALQNQAHGQRVEGLYHLALQVLGVRVNGLPGNGLLYTIIPNEFQCHIKDAVHKRLYDELKSIDASDFAFSGAYLLRAFIEQTTRAYSKKHKLALKGELHVLLGAAANHLQQYRICFAPCVA